MALHQQGILNPAEQKAAFFLSLSQAVRGKAVAHFAPARVFNHRVTFEDVLRYFRQINDQLYTPRWRVEISLHAARATCLLTTGLRSYDAWQECAVLRTLTKACWTPS